ncbi:MAG: IS110 family transposase, partial [Candidatus Bathyarchaeia archaeon]
GIKTRVVASSLIPDIPSHRVKTDRTDAEKLLQFWLQDLLTFVTPPSPEEEEARSLIRCREFLVRMRKSTHARILSLVHVYGLEYLQAEQKKTYRSKHFWAWLRREITQMPEGWRFIFNSLVDGYDMIDNLIKTYDSKIEGLSQLNRYRDQVLTLTQFWGVSPLVAMTIICEIGDIRRFASASQLMSYVGFSISEYSSGGRERKMGITKSGNSWLRLHLIRIFQKYKWMKFSTLSKRCKSHRSQAPAWAYELSQKCLLRLKTKAQRLSLRDKPSNKIKVALAREFVGFVWEALMRLSNEKSQLVSMRIVSNEVSAFNSY